jgi:hypothetical protein
MILTSLEIIALIQLQTERFTPCPERIIELADELKAARGREANKSNERTDD